MLKVYLKNLCKVCSYNFAQFVWLAKPDKQIRAIINKVLVDIFSFLDKCWPTIEIVVNMLSWFTQKNSLW